MAKGVNVERLALGSCEVSKRVKQGDYILKKTPKVAVHGKSFEQFMTKAAVRRFLDMLAVLLK